LLQYFGGQNTSSVSRLAQVWRAGATIAHNRADMGVSRFNQGTSVGNGGARMQNQKRKK